VFFPISAQIITQSAGQLIKLSYEVTVGGKTAVSDVQELTFQAQGGGVSTSVAVGRGPHAISITNDGRRAFVPCRDSNSVSVIDINARKVIYTIPGIAMPFLSVLSPDNRRLYVGNFGGRSYTVIDTATYQVLMTVPITGGDDVVGLAITADGLRLFVACTKNSFVSVHDTATGAVINRISVTTEPFGIAINPEQTQVLIASRSAIGIINANGSSGLVGTIAGTGRPAHVAFNPGNAGAGRAYVTDVDGVLIIDLLKNIVISKIAGIRYAWGATVNPNAHELWVSGVGPGGTTAHRDSVYIINTDTGQIARRLTGFDNAANIAFVPNARLALIANQATGLVSFVPA
jgi:YVTN family beta-propeller protein